MTGRASLPTSCPGCSSATSSRTGGEGRRKGSGLGLAIVSELATAMGATVQADSPVDDGHGTRMVVWLRPAPPPADSAVGRNR